MDLKFVCFNLYKENWYKNSLYLNKIFKVFFLYDIYLTICIEF